MDYSVSINLPNYGEDEVEVLYLGRFPNGETSAVTEEQVANWERERRQEWPKSGELVIPDHEVQVLSDVPADAEYPHHKGGGVYILSDGSEVKGKEAAQKAQNELNGDSAGGD